MQIIRLHWQDTIPIRQKVLWPNKAQEFCHAEGDDDAWHYGVTVDQTLVCVASVFPEANKIDNNESNVDENNNDKNTDNHDRHTKSVRLRKFATLSSSQGKGIGSFLLNHLIESLKADDFTYFWFDARESALEFYERFGFKAEGERFYKSNIPYYKMYMHLT